MLTNLESLLAILIGGLVGAVLAQHFLGTRAVSDRILWPVVTGVVGVMVGCLVTRVGRS